MIVSNAYSNAIIRRMQRWRCRYAYQLSSKPILYMNKTYISLFFDYEGKWSRPDQEHNSRKGIEYILWKLDQVGIKATFNCVGHLVNDRQDMLQKINQSGHEIASHTVGHTLVNNWSKELVSDDIHEFRTLLSPITKNIIGFRAPQAKWNFETLHALLDNGIFWDAADDPAPYPYIILQKENRRLWRMPARIDDWNFEKNNADSDVMLQAWRASVLFSVRHRHYFAVGFHPWVLGKDESRLLAFSKFIDFLVEVPDIIITQFGDIVRICEGQIMVGKQHDHKC